MDKSYILKAFNTQLNEFLSDLLLIFPNDTDLDKLKSSVTSILKLNVTMILKTWFMYSKNYIDQIENGDINFLIENDYSNELKDVDKKVADTVMNKLSTQVKKLDDSNKETAMVYIQNLTKLANVYTNLS
jgi:hypothetical protein